MPTFLVTGCSSGIGLVLIKLLASRGDKVFATCRKRESSRTGVDLISEVAGDVTILEGIDVAVDSVGEALAKALEGVTVDVLINNAGSFNSTRDILEPGALFAEQSLERISMERMRSTFELNALGPLRVMKAVLPNMRSPGGKVITVSTGMGSIGDNTSGGKYGYRASKAAVNMITKGFSCDLEGKGIAVAAVAPGMLATEFGPGAEIMKNFGAALPGPCCEKMLTIIDDLSLENTGKFLMIPTSGEPVREYPW